MLPIIVDMHVHVHVHSLTTHRFPHTLILLHTRCVKDGSVVPADGQVVMVMLTQLNHQMIILQFQLLRIDIMYTMQYTSISSFLQTTHHHPPLLHFSPQPVYSYKEVERESLAVNTCQIFHEAQSCTALYILSGYIPDPMPT